MGLGSIKVRHIPKPPMIRIAGFSSVEAPSEGDLDAIVGATDVRTDG